MGVNHPTLNIPNMQYILPPELKKSDHRGPKSPFWVKKLPLEAWKWLSKIRVDIRTLSDVYSSGETIKIDVKNTKKYEIRIFFGILKTLKFLQKQKDVVVKR